MDEDSVKQLDRKLLHSRRFRFAMLIGILICVSVCGLYVWAIEEQGGIVMDGSSMHVQFINDTDQDLYLRLCSEPFVDLSESLRVNEGKKLLLPDHGFR